MLNGINNADMPAMLADQYPVTYTRKSDKEHVFGIMVSDTESITISSFKDLVGVKFSNATYDHFGKSVGLLGDFANGELLGRDGIVMEDPNEFGQEWQVLDTERKLFQVARAPQHPQKCNMPHPVAAENRRRRLGESVSEEAAKLACTHRLSEKEIDMCVYDVMATGDLEIAQAGVF